MVLACNAHAPYPCTWPMWSLSNSHIPKYLFQPSSDLASIKDGHSFFLKTLFLDLAWAALSWLSSSTATACLWDLILPSSLWLLMLPKFLSSALFSLYMPSMNNHNPSQFCKSYQNLKKFPKPSFSLLRPPPPPLPFWFQTHICLVTV